LLHADSWNVCHVTPPCTKSVALRFSEIFSKWQDYLGATIKRLAATNVSGAAFGAALEQANDEPETRKRNQNNDLV
jgi:hypothetical protein